MVSNITPEQEFSDPNDFYTEEESERYNNSSGMRNTQEQLTKIALDLSSSISSIKTIDILDVGCGTGFSLEYLTSLGYLNLKGIDPSKEMVRIAKNKKLKVKIGGFKDLSKITDKFDFIISISALQWILSGKQDIEIKNIIKKIGKEFKRLLKKPGFAIIQFYPEKPDVFETIISSFNRCELKASAYIYNSDSLKKRKFFIILEN